MVCNERKLPGIPQKGLLGWAGCVLCRRDRSRGDATELVLFLQEAGPYMLLTSCFSILNGANALADELTHEQAHTDGLS